MMTATAECTAYGCDGTHHPVVQYIDARTGDVTRVRDVRDLADELSCDDPANWREGERVEVAYAQCMTCNPPVPEAEPAVVQRRESVAPEAEDESSELWWQR